MFSIAHEALNFASLPVFCPADSQHPHLHQHPCVRTCSLHPWSDETGEDVCPCGVCLQEVRYQGGIPWRELIKAGLIRNILTDFSVTVPAQ